MKIKSIVTVLFMVLILSSCAPTSIPTSLPTPTEATVPTSTLTPVPLTSIATTIIKVDSWKEYENALALEILQTSDALCEWNILGQENQDVYVWAMCQITNLEIGSAASVPAVIHLGNNGSIEKVQIPRDGTQYGIDIRKMFPKELHDKIFEQSAGIDALWSHLELRQKNHEPPLNVLSGVSLP
jgi:hypothetical protein